MRQQKDNMLINEKHAIWKFHIRHYVLFNSCLQLCAALWNMQPNVDLTYSSVGVSRDSPAILRSDCLYNCVYYDFFSCLNTRCKCKVIASAFGDRSTSQIILAPGHFCALWSWVHTPFLHSTTPVGWWDPLTYMRSVQKVLSLTQNELEKQESFFTIFQLTPPLGLTTFKQCNPVTEEGVVLVLQTLPRSTYLITVSKMSSTRVRWSWVRGMG